MLCAACRYNIYTASAPRYATTGSHSRPRILPFIYIKYQPAVSPMTQQVVARPKTPNTRTRSSSPPVITSAPLPTPPNMIASPSKTPNSREKRKSLRRSVGLLNLDLAGEDENCQIPSTPSRKRHHPHKLQEVCNNSTTTLTQQNIHKFRPPPGLTSRNSYERSHSAPCESSFEGVKPLQAAFASSGLMSKRNRRPPALQMPETPCKPRAESAFDFDLEKPDSRLFSTPCNLSADVSRCSLSMGSGYSPTRMSTPAVKGTQAQRLVSDASTITPSFSRRPGGLDFDQGRFERLTLTSPSTPVDSDFSISNVTADTSLSGSSGDFYTSLPVSAKTPKEVFENSLAQRFETQTLLGEGEFSMVWSVTTSKAKYAVKRTKKPLTGAKQRARRYEEVQALTALHAAADDPVIQHIESWEENGHLYIMTEFCENGNLDSFLSELGHTTRLDEWRVWKILADIASGLKFIHSRGYAHLDIKPANIFITFDGSLKIGDFGMAVKVPAPPGVEREGDREYIAPEVLSRGAYDTPADIFSMGIMIVEIAANIVLPDNGEHWHKLRSGDLTDAGRLSSGDIANGEHDGLPQPRPSWAPAFMIDDSRALDRMVSALLSPDPINRPTAREILSVQEVQIVESRRRAGAIVFEGDFGPEPEWAIRNDVWQRS